MGRKSGDEWTVPLCRPCHTNVHLVGTKKEPGWFYGYGVECAELADALWKVSGNLYEMKRVLLKFAL